MNTHAESRRTQLSPGLAVVLGLLLLAANIVVDVYTGGAVAQPKNHSVQSLPPNG